MQAPTPNPRTSVLIITRNRPAALRTALNSVFAQTQPPGGFEVIVHDDASDPHLSLQPESFPDYWGVKIDTCDTPLGVAGGRNRLMTLARGEYWVFLDDDAVFLTQSALADIVALFESHPSIGAIAANIDLVPAGTSKSESSATDLPKPPRSKQVPFSRAALRQSPHIVDSDRRVSYFVGAAHALRASAVREVGPYQHDLVWGEEELDLSYRLIRGRWEILYSANLRVEHRPLPSVLRRGLSDEIYYHTRNRLILAFKYLPMPYRVTYLLFWTAFNGLRALRHGAGRGFVRGLRAGLQQGRVRRSPLMLDGGPINYLRQNYGRLWY